MTDVRISAQRVEVGLQDVTSDLRVSNVVTQVAVVIPKPEPDVLLSAAVVQIAMVVDPSSVSLGIANQVWMTALQIRRGTLPIDGGKRQDIIDANDRMYVYGLPRGTDE